MSFALGHCNVRARSKDSESRAFSCFQVVRFSLHQKPLWSPVKVKRLFTPHREKKLPLVDVCEMFRAARILPSPDTWFTSPSTGGSSPLCWGLHGHPEGELQTSLPKPERSLPQYRGKSSPVSWQSQGSGIAPSTPSVARFGKKEQRLSLKFPSLKLCLKKRALPVSRGRGAEWLLLLI